VRVFLARYGNVGRGQGGKALDGGRGVGYD
jgi:hypothetical protein